MYAKHRIKRPFGERIVESASRDERSVYIIAIVGEEKTEEQYFDGLKVYAIDKGIQENIIIERLEKELHIEGNSHPKHILELLLERKSGWEDWGVLPHEFWMIIDRDPQDRSREQLTEIFDQCQKEQFNVGLTNPVFELWLLMHLTDLSVFNQQDLLQNKRSGPGKRGRRFIEKEISQILDGFQKRNLDMSKFLNGIDLAIFQADRIDNNLKYLIDNMGTNVHLLVKRILKR